MAILGIVGGIAPPSTVAYYRSCLDAYLAATGRSLRVLIDSIDSNGFYRLLETELLARGPGRSWEECGQPASKQGVCHESRG